MTVAAPTARSLCWALDATHPHPDPAVIGGVTMTVREQEADEGSTGVSRIEASSDGVIGIIKATGRQGPAETTYHRRASHKGVAALIIYSTAIGLTFISPWLGIGCAVIVAILWFLPQSALDELFGK